MHFGRFVLLAGRQEIENNRASVESFPRLKKVSCIDKKVFSNDPVAPPIVARPA
jgi:hypothetical protein